MREPVVDYVRADPPKATSIGHPPWWLLCGWIVAIAGAVFALIIAAYPQAIFSFRALYSGSDFPM